MHSHSAMFHSVNKWLINGLVRYKSAFLHEVCRELFLCAKGNKSSSLKSIHILKFE